MPAYGLRAVGLGRRPSADPAQHGWQCQPSCVPAEGTFSGSNVRLAQVSKSLVYCTVSKHNENENQKDNYKSTEAKVVQKHQARLGFHCTNVPWVQEGCRGRGAGPGTVAADEQPRPAQGGLCCRQA